MSTKKNLKALICGHTGATGQALLNELIASPDYESIVAVGRRESVAHRGDRKSTRLNSSHSGESRMPSSA